MLKNRPRAVSVSVFIVIAVFLLGGFVPIEVLAQDYYPQNFEWTYDNKDWTWSLRIPKSTYDTYRSVSVSRRSANGAAGYGFLTTTDDECVKAVAEELHNASLSEGYDSYDEVSFVLSFVQSLPYAADSVTTQYDEYPRFPVETLVDNGGDCEDTSILFATIILLMGYDTVYINPPDHIAVGVLGEDLLGSYYTYENKTYYFCETTGENFAIGDLPDQFNGVKSYIYKIDVNRQFEPLSVNYDPANNESSIGFSDFLGLVFVILVVSSVVGAAFYAFSQKKGAPPIVVSATMNPNQAPIPSTNSSEASLKFCRYCGIENKADAVFCEKCGRQLR